MCTYLYLIYQGIHLITCQEVQSHYSKLGAEAGPIFAVIFYRDEVSLDIPREGIRLPSGWSLTPLKYPTKVYTTCTCINLTLLPIFVSQSSSFHTPDSVAFLLLDTANGCG